MLFFTFIKGGGVTPLTGPPNLNGFSSIIRGGGVKSLLTNVNKKMVFFNEGFPYKDKDARYFVDKWKGRRISISSHWSIILIGFHIWPPV